jgi:diadenylate cyclase
MFNEILSYLQFQIGTLDWSLNLTNIFEIAIIIAILFFFYKKFIKDSQSEKFVKGIFFLIFLWVFSEILVRLNLKILGMFLKSIVTLVSLSLVVIFQPELRRFLGFLGQANIFTRLFETGRPLEADENIDVIKELIEAVKDLSKKHTGALIVFQKDLSNTEAGTKLNADVSTELLLTIFYEGTPLHDGAVVINGTKIISAGVLLPVTGDPKLSWKYGTRHRAAIGMSEISDAACLVVSEETGDVSIALDGTIKKYEDITTLKSDLERILGYKTQSQSIEKKAIFSFNNFMEHVKHDHTKGNNKN